MASRNRENGTRLRRKNARELIGEERKISSYYNFVTDGEEIDSDLPVPNLSFGLASTLVTCVSVLCYYNSCKGEFVFDDSEAIVANKDLTPDIPLGELFYHDFWGANISSNTSHKSYRPFTILTFRFNYWLAEGLHPWGFHVVNVTLHAVVSVLCLKLFSIIFNGKNNVKFYCDNNSSARTHFTASRASLVGAILFAVHPIHTECVSGLVGRADLLGALFFILSFLFYVKCCSVDSDVNGSTYKLSWKYLLSSMVSCCIAMLCKEQGITVLGVCCVYDLIVACEIDPASLLTKVSSKVSSPEKRNGKNSKEKNESTLWIKLAYRQIVLFLAGITLLVGRWRIMGSSPPVFQVVDNPASFEESLIMRIINYNYLYAINAWLLIVPQWLCFDWSMGCVPLINSLSDPRMLCIVGLWTVLLVLIAYCVFGKSLPNKRILTLGLAFVVVPFLPATNIFFRVGFVVAERVLYLSSIGSCLLTVLGFTLLSKFPLGKKVIGFGMVLLIALYLSRTIQRSGEWINEDTLFTSGLSVCPLNAKVHYNVAKVRGEKGRIEAAEAFYREAIRLNPTYDQAFNNLGNLIKDNGRYEEAEALLEKAVEIRNDFAAGWMNLGTVKAALQKLDEAEKCYSNAIRYRRKYPDAYFNLGNLYIDREKHKEAIVAFKMAVNIKNNHVGAWMNHALLLEKSGNRDEAISVLLEAKKYIGNESTVYFNLGNMLGQNNKFQEAEQQFLEALKLSPNSAEIHGNLGVLYHRWGKHSKAEKCYTKALQLDPQSENVHENLEKLKRTKRHLANGRSKGR